MPAARKRVLKPAVRVIVALVILGCVAWVARGYWRQRQLIVAENAAVELQNQERYAQAAAAYEALIPSTRDEQNRRVRHNAAVCYAVLAEEPSLDLRASLELYQKAYDLDPSTVTNPAILKMLQGAK